jgi:protein arginine kinase activator
MDAAKGSAGDEVELRCPRCGLSYSEFRQRGRLGCSDDYKLFREGLSQLLERIHGSTQHLGKIPSRAGANLKRERELIELKRELTRVIQREEYERAAQVRDQIRRMEEQEQEQDVERD